MEEKSAKYFQPTDEEALRHLGLDKEKEPSKELPQILMIGQKVLLKKILKPKKQSLILVASEKDEEEDLMGEVVAVGKHEGIEVGDKVMFKSGFEQLFFQGHEFWLGKVDNLIAKIV